MQLSATQALVLVLVLLDGARAAPMPRDQKRALGRRQLDPPHPMVDPPTGSELPPIVDEVFATLHQYDERGLLDPLTGILGALPGVLSGVLGTVTSVVGGLLGSLGLGNLLITDPSSGAQGMHVYLVQANNGTIAMASNVTDPTLLAAMNMSRSDMVLATLHVPVVNQTTMNIADLCVTSTGPGPSALTASSCKDQSLHQLFVYNSITNAVFSVPDLLSCSFAAANATTAATPAASPLGGTANIIMVERDDAPALAACNATSKAIVFNPANANTNTKQAVVTVTPTQATGAVTSAAPAMDFAAGDHNPGAMYDGQAGSQGGW